MLTAVPISKYLAEVPLARAPGDSVAVRQSRPPKLAEIRPETDYSAEIERAYRRGLEEGRALARAESATRLDELRQSMEDQRLADRHAWTQEEADRLAQSVDQSMDRLTTAIASTVARVLQPFLIEERRRQAVHELAQAILTIGQRPGEMELSITGPEDLLQALVDRLNGRFQMTLQVADVADITVRVDDTIIETRIGAWIASVAGATRVG